MSPLIADLALILISAGLVTLLFKRLRQPLVLGYIVAGFLAGPHMPYTPTVTDLGSLHIWADIGVIFLMFTLGLEFSFKKIVRMGARPVIAACCIMFCMMSLGSGIGHLFGWGSMNSLFLGGMLAMSSTTIIYKAFDDLGLRQQQFAGEVLSVLILEDILGILLMVVLSATAVSRQFQGAELVMSLLQLSFFLILWFVVGVFLIPAFLRRSDRLMTGETLLVVSIGLCFLLVVLAVKAGYSAAFGAFMMGSILAETLQAERIERVVAPVKDLFGAVFFVSVGMMVDPAVLVQHALPIFVLSLAIIGGQALFGTTGFLLSGQPLRSAVKGGFSLAQIGEFAFIIAALGTSLHVTSDFLHPVVVAVSILTTFLTPYMIKAATPACNFLERHIPDNLLNRLSRQKKIHAAPAADASAAKMLWKKLLFALGGQIGAYLTLSIAVILLSFSVLLPLCRALLGHWPGNIVCGLLTLSAAAPFLRALVMRKNHSEEWKQLRRRSKLHRTGLWLTFALRFLLASGVICYVLEFLSPTPLWLHALLAPVVMGIIISLRFVKWTSIRLERTFLQNLRSRENVTPDAATRPLYAGRLAARHLHIARIEIPETSAWGGRSLHSLQLRPRFGVTVAAVVRGAHRLNIPGGDTLIFPGDRLDVIGDDSSLESFTRSLNADTLPDLTPVSQVLLLRRLVIREESPFLGLSLRESGIRENHRCMVVGFETDNGDIEPAAAERTITRGDVLWLVGEEEQMKEMGV